MPYDIEGLVKSPQFAQLSDEQKRELLTRAGAPPEFTAKLLGQEVTAPPETFMDRLQAGLRQVVTTKFPSALTDLAGPYGMVFRDPLSGTASIEQGLENLPLLGGVFGGAAGTPTAGTASAPLAAVGAVVGEGTRQGARSLLGLPAATGFWQRHLELDPDSPEASLAGLGGEAAMTPVAALASKILGGASKAVDRSSLRSLINLIKPRTQMDKKKALELAERARQEGIVAPFSGREAQVRVANERLEEATRDLDLEERLLRMRNATVPTGNFQVPVPGVPGGRTVQGILPSVVGEVPPLMSGGQMPQTGLALRNAAERMLADEVTNIAGRPQIPVWESMHQKELWDSVLEGFHEGGRESVPMGIKSVKNAADAHRRVLHEFYPELGERLSRKSDLLTITGALEDALRESRVRGGIGSAAEEANTVGSAAAGRWSIPFMTAVRAIQEAGPVAGTSSILKSLAAGGLRGAADTAQAGARVGDLFNLEPEEDRPYERPVDLLELLGLRMPTPVVSEEEFIRRYGGGR